MNMNTVTCTDKSCSNEFVASKPDTKRLKPLKNSFFRDVCLALSFCCLPVSVYVILRWGHALRRIPASLSFCAQWRGSKCIELKQLSPPPLPGHVSCKMMMLRKQNSKSIGKMRLFQGSSQKAPCTTSSETTAL